MIEDGYPKLILTPLFSSSTDWQPAAAGKCSCPSHFQIRPAQSVDLTALAEILADGFHSQEGIFGWAYPLLRLGIYEDLRNRLRSASPHYICLVAYDPAATCTSEGDDLTGTVEMAVRSTDLWQCDGNASAKSVRCRYPYLSNLAVRPTHQRRGIAQQLLLKCERVALSWGFQDIYLHVLENNHQARQLYFKLGYRLHQVDSSWSAWLLGRPRQLFLHKRLRAD
jgi:ribosomal protein S18 acetylase RimI-like enzyme